MWTRNFETIERDINSRIQKLETDDENYQKKITENKLELVRLSKLLGKKEVK